MRFMILLKSDEASLLLVQRKSDDVSGQVCIARP